MGAGAVVAAGAEVGAAGDGLLQAANAIDISNVRLSRKIMVISPCQMNGTMLNYFAGLSRSGAAFPKRDNSQFSPNAV